ncbi:MAG: hypothetical protein DRO92_00835 [Candidatus Altiarchaeales archaeon]|nr:MAG: hypothetical protein DRO92_00835 [Candidatus Altiarchaeales archaeon]
MAERYVILETNVDDCTPEMLSYLTERVMNEDALDIQIISTLMKKGRYGFLIRIISKEGDAEKFSKILMEETGTLGVRVIPAIERYETKREIVEKEIKIFGNIERIRVKKSKYNMKPEFDDLRRICIKYRIPFREALKMVKSIIDDSQ